MLIPSIQTAAAFGNVVHRLKLASMSAHLALVEIQKNQRNAQVVRTGMETGTRHSYLMKGKAVTLQTMWKGIISRFPFWPEGPTCTWPLAYEGSCTMGGNNL